MSRFSLRWVLLGTVLGAITLAFTVFAVYLDRVEQVNRLDDIDTDLVRAERAALGPPGVDGSERVPPPGDGGADLIAADLPVELVLDADGEVVASPGVPSPFSPATLASLAMADGNQTTSDPRFRVRITETTDGSVVVTALPLDGFDTAVGRFRVALIAGGGVILGLVAATLWVLTGWLTRPLSRMAESARGIAAGDLETPVGLPAGTRETVELTVDLDLMVGRLRGALDEANRSREASERLLADLAHEIRTPLTALKGYSDLYAQGMLGATSDVDRAMSRIGSESERLNALANTMLQLADERTGDLEVEEFDLAQLAEEVATDLRAAYPDQQLELRVDQLGLHRMRGSRDRMQQAILNLGANACHHTALGTTIDIAVARQSEALQLTVADHGPGIDPADGDRIFLPFYRSDEARSRDGQDGAGLGLALVRQIAEQHYGSASVDSNPAGGATFTLTIPAT